MITLTVNVNTSNADAAEKLLASPRPLLAVAAKAVEDTLRRHFLARNAEPNRMGWPKKNFWAKQGANNTAVASVTDDAAVVLVSSPQIAHKLLGGTIRPGPGKKFLCIPLTAEAYKVGSPRNWPGTGRGKGTNWGRIPKGMYAFVRSVTQAPDPRTLPERDAMEAAAGDAVNKLILRRTARSA